MDPVKLQAVYAFIEEVLAENFYGKIVLNCQGGVVSTVQVENTVRVSDLVDAMGEAGEPGEPGEEEPAEE